VIYTGNLNTLDDLPKTTARAVKDLATHVGEFDSIAVTGMSGALVGAPVSIALHKPLVVVRKPEDSSHDVSLGRPVLNAERLGKRVLFLDDFVAMGSTHHRVKEAIEARGATIVASYLYGTGPYGDTPEYIAGQPPRAHPDLA
jgi:adenine/guanine phosphoribosyltransferase-like PRPP-binding protein